VSGNRLSGYARSDANVEQIVENLQEQEVCLNSPVVLTLRKLCGVMIAGLKIY